MSGFVYAIQAAVGGPVKIGYSTNPAQRLDQLQAANHAELCIRHVFEGDLSDETSLQDKITDLSIRGEWYEDGVGLWEAWEACRSAARLRGVREVLQERIAELFEAAVHGAIRQSGSLREIVSEDHVCEHFANAAANANEILADLYDRALGIAQDEIERSKEHVLQ